MSILTLYTEPTKFSNLYYRCENKNYNNVDELKENPFSIFQELVDILFTEPNRHNSFGLKFSKILYDELEKLRITTYKYFEIELLNSTTSRSLYLNEGLKYLIELFGKIGNYNSQNIITYGFYKSYLLDTVKEIIYKIVNKHHLDINSKNRLFLSRWFLLKEPIKSFRFTSFPEEQRLKKLYEKYLINIKYHNTFIYFISRETSFNTFKALFEGRYLTEKINWIENKSSLYYFIKMLKDNKVVKPTKNKHWRITSEFFLLNGETLTPEDFLHQKETQDKAKRKQLESFIKALVSNPN